MPSANPSPNKRKRKPLDNYLRFSGLAFQMFAIIGLSTFLGDFIDARFERQFPLFTIILSLFGVFSALYLVIKEVNKNNND